MSTDLNMLQIAVRIFSNGTVLRNKVIYVNTSKVVAMPIIANSLDIQDCHFWYVNDTTRFKRNLKLKLKFFWNFKVLRKSHFMESF